jgi:hypothetical protein
MEEAKFFRKKNDSYYVACYTNEEGAYPIQFKAFPPTAIVKEEVGLEDYMTSFEKNQLPREELATFNLFNDSYVV